MRNKKERIVCEEYVVGSEKEKVNENVEEIAEEVKEENVEVLSQIEEPKNQYLDSLQRLQADFDNYRKRSNQQIIDARNDGKISIIEAFLPCLDTFKEAKKSISDEKVLEGVVMIENKILKTLEEVGVTKIDTTDKMYDPNFHNAIAVMRNEEKENDIILDEFQAGYIFNGKVIRYSKVIVNKKED